MANIFDTIGGFSSSISQQGAGLQDKLAQGVDVAEQYAALQLILQGIATFAAVGMLHMYVKTFNLHANRRGGVRNNPRKKRRQRSR